MISDDQKRGGRTRGVVGFGVATSVLVAGS